MAVFRGFHRGHLGGHQWLQWLRNKPYGVDFIIQICILFGVAGGFEHGEGRVERV
jgi:hypothetical protein